MCWMKRRIHSRMTCFCSAKDLGFVSFPFPIHASIGTKFNRNHLFRFLFTQSRRSPSQGTGRFVKDHGPGHWARLHRISWREYLIFDKFTTKFGEPLLHFHHRRLKDLFWWHFEKFLHHTLEIALSCWILCFTPNRTWQWPNQASLSSKFKACLNTNISRHHQGAI